MWNLFENVAFWTSELQNMVLRSSLSYVALFQYWSQLYWRSERQAGGGDVRRRGNPGGRDGAGQDRGGPLLHAQQSQVEGTIIWVLPDSKKRDSDPEVNLHTENTEQYAITKFF